MAVLVEGLSVVVRNDALLRKFHGGPRRFQEGLQDESICFDNDLTCIHLRSPDEVERFIGWCESMGLTFALGGKAAVMLPLFCGVLSSRLTRLFCAVPRTSVSRIA